MNPSQLIDKNIKDLGDWRGEMMSQLRKIIRAAVPGIEEVWKWDTPVFALKGNVCAIGAFKDHVKINFFKGAKINSKLFNSGLESKVNRGIDFYERDKIDESSIKELVRAAVRLNQK